MHRDNFVSTFRVTNLVTNVHLHFHLAKFSPPIFRKKMKQVLLP